MQHQRMFTHMSMYGDCMMDLAAVTTLRAVAEHGTVIAAAEATGYTPSAVSQQVKRLERQLGLPLLERVGRGVMLTDHGRQLCAAGGEVLAHVEEVEARIQGEVGRVSGHLRVAAFSTAMRGMLAPVAQQLGREHPDLRLTLTDTEPWEAVDAVASGRAEISVAHSWGTVPLVIPEHVRARVVRHDVADVVVHESHRLAGRTRVAARDLVEESWVATSEGTICREWLDHMHAVNGRRPQIAHVSGEFDVHLALVAAGLGVALVPRMGRAALPPGTCAVAVTDPVPTREVVVLHRRSMDPSPSVQAVLAAIGTA